MSMFHVKYTFLEVIPFNFSESFSNFFTEEIPAFFSSFTSDPSSSDIGGRTAAEHFGVFDSASSASPVVDSYGILDMINALNQADRENTQSSVDAQKELLSLQNQYNSSAALEAWNRYKDYDSSKVQRYVNDMRAAGINPIIAFGSSGMPNISSAMPSASSVSPWTSQKASAHGESAIGKQQELVQGYIGMIKDLVATGINAAGNVLGSSKGLLSTVMSNNVNGSATYYRYGRR